MRQAVTTNAMGIITCTQDVIFFIFQKCRRKILPQRETNIYILTTKRVHFFEHKSFCLRNIFMDLRVGCKFDLHHGCPHETHKWALCCTVPQWQKQKKHLNLQTQIARSLLQTFGLTSDNPTPFPRQSSLRHIQLDFVAEIKLTNALQNVSAKQFCDLQNVEGCRTKMIQTRHHMNRFNLSKRAQCEGVGLKYQMFVIRYRLSLSCKVVPYLNRSRNLSACG